MWSSRSVFTLSHPVLSLHLESPQDKPRVCPIMYSMCPVYSIMKFFAWLTSLRWFTKCKLIFLKKHKLFFYNNDPRFAECRLCLGWAKPQWFRRTSSIPHRTDLPTYLRKVRNYSHHLCMRVVATFTLTARKAQRLHLQNSGSVSLAFTRRFSVTMYPLSLTPICVFVCVFASVVIYYYK